MRDEAALRHSSWDRGDVLDSAADVRKASARRPRTAMRMTPNLQFMIRFLLLQGVLAAIGGLVGMVGRIYDSPLGGFIAGTCLFSLPAFLLAFFLSTCSRKPARRVALGVFTIFLVGTGFLSLVCFPAPPEGKNLLCPDCDTRFAAGYTDEGFAKVRPGMTEQDLVSLLGQPVHRQTEWFRQPFLAGAEVLWWYSSDGASTSGDYAWRAPIVGLRQGVVVTNYIVWCYD